MTNFSSLSFKDQMSKKKARKEKGERNERRKKRKHGAHQNENESTIINERQIQHGFPERSHASITDESDFDTRFPFNDTETSSSQDDARVIRGGSALAIEPSSLTFVAPPAHTVPQHRLTISTNSSDWEKFKTAVARDCYMKNAFPNNLEIESNCRRIVFHIRGIDLDNNSYGVSGELEPMYISILNQRRSNLHTQVKNWVISYPFTEIEGQCSREHLFTYLLEHRRILRENFDKEVRLLFNPCITKCIEYTLLNRKGGGPKMKHRPSILPKETISLIVCQILYRLGLLANDPISSIEESGAQFSDESSWKELYLDLLTGDVEGQKIDWPAVSSYLTAQLSTDNRRCKVSTRKMLLG